MPKMDGNGPLGQGPLVGRGLGPCGGGMGGGYRRRKCFNRFFHSPKNQLQALEEEEILLTKELEIIKAEKEALQNQQ